MEPTVTENPKILCSATSTTDSFMYSYQTKLICKMEHWEIFQGTENEGQEVPTVGTLGHIHGPLPDIKSKYFNMLCLTEYISEGFKSVKKTDK